MKKQFKKKASFIEKMILLLYPQTCPICREILEHNNFRVCEKCRKKIKYIEEPACKKCGKQLIQEEQEYCYDCFEKKHYFTRGVALWLHNDLIRKSIYNFKYNDKRDYAKVYANEIVIRHKNKINNWHAQALIPIPLHKSKMRHRGFNQTEDLCKELEKQLEIPMLNHYVKRVKKTLPQKDLDNKQRINNLKNAFKIEKNDVKLKKVILIDDIYTTGATIDSVAEVLKNSGVDEIYFITISIGEGL